MLRRNGPVVKSVESVLRLEGSLWWERFVIQMRPVPTDPSPTSHIRRCFVSRNVGLLMRAFVMYVRRLLEYSSVIWSLSLERDVALVKQVQRRFTKRLPGSNNHSYDERLKLLNLERLDLRRIWSDLLWCYKFVFGLVHVNKGEFFTLVLSST